MSAANPIPEERWRPIASFPGYEVSDLGNVRSRKAKGRTLRPVKLYPHYLHGYVQVHLSHKSRGYTRSVHRLVAEAFLGPLLPGQPVNHKDKCRANNQVDNLEIVTNSVNEEHRRLFGWVRLAVQQALREFMETYRPGG